MQAPSRPELPSPEPKNTDFAETVACDDPGEFFFLLYGVGRLSNFIFLAFFILGLAPPMREYTSGGRSQRPHLNVSPELSPISPTSHSTVLTASPMSEISEKSTSGALQRSSSGSQSSYRVSARRSIRYTPFSGVPFHSSHWRKGRSTMHKNSTNIAGSSGPTQNRAVSRAL